MKYYSEFDYNKKDNEITLMILGFCVVIGLITFGVLIGQMM
jgi:hypothetical protein